MRIIHCADVHLGSKMDTKFPKEISDERKLEIRSSFERMVSYAQKNDISVILLSGDVFDSDNPFKKDKDFFYEVVKKNPQIDFLYLRGNHDAESVNNEQIENLKTFSDEWTSYPYGELEITGIEETRENATSLYSTLSLKKDKRNIVMLHGQIGSEMGKDKVNLLKLRDKNIDYLALGHIHSYSEGKLDERGKYAYSGCLEGRGFDDIGQKGFVCLDVSDKISANFIPFSDRLILEVKVDISSIRSAYEIAQKIREEVKFNKKNIYRILLTGEIDFDVYSFTEDIKKYLCQDCYFIDVKDETKKKIDIRAYEGDASLKGEFVRKVYGDSRYTDEEKMQIISYGLRALLGREVD